MKARKQAKRWGVSAGAALAAEKHRLKVMESGDTAAKKALSTHVYVSQLIEGPASMPQTQRYAGHTVTCRAKGNKTDQNINSYFRAKNGDLLQG